MFGTQESSYRPTFETADFGGPHGEVISDNEPEAVETAPEVVAEQPADEPVNGDELDGGRWHAAAGRKGAHRIHQLIQEGRLYEQEHGLKSGRQRLRQLIELGKLYEQEHGIEPRQPKKSGRLSRSERQEVLSTLVQCLIRVAKPSFRAELTRLAEALQREDSSAA